MPSNSRIFHGLDGLDALVVLCDAGREDCFLSVVESEFFEAWDKVSPNEQNLIYQKIIRNNQDQKSFFNEMITQVQELSADSA